MFYNKLKKHIEKHGGQAGFRMGFQFMGHEVCREAFITLSGISAVQLQRCRDHACAEPPRLNPLVRGDLPLHLSGQQAHKYISCRSWLIVYAERHADHSPMDGLLWLPVGRAQYYYAIYREDCRRSGCSESAVASIQTFLEMWRFELPWIKIRLSNSPFTQMWTVRIS